MNRFLKIKFPVANILLNLCTVLLALILNCINFEHLYEDGKVFKTKKLLTFEFAGFATFFTGL